MTQNNQSQEHKYSKSSFEEYEKNVKKFGEPEDKEHWTYRADFQKQLDNWRDSTKLPVSEKFLVAAEEEAIGRASVESKRMKVIRESLNRLNPQYKEGDTALERDTKEVQTLNEELYDMQQVWNKTEWQQPLWRRISNIHEEGGALDILRDEMNVKRDRRKELKTKWDYQDPMAGRGVHSYTRRAQVEQLQNQLAFLQEKINVETSLADESKEEQKVPWYDQEEAQAIVDSLNAIPQKR